MIGDIFGFLVTHRIHILIFFVGYVLGCLTIIINYYSHNRDRGVENQNLRVQKQNLQDQNQNLRVKDKQIKDARKTRPPEHPNPKDPHNTKPKMNGPSNSNNLKEKGVPGAPCGFQDEDHLELFIVDSFESELVENYNQAVLADNVGAFRVKYGAQLKRVGPEEKQTEKVTLAERNDGDFYAISDKESGSHLVLPRLGIVFADFHYGPGKMRKVFECPDIDLTLTYEKVTVEFPARFKLEGDSLYTLEKMGCLILGDGKQL